MALYFTIRIWGYKNIKCIIDIIIQYVINKNISMHLLLGNRILMNSIEKARRTTIGS